MHGQVGRPRATERRGSTIGERLDGGPNSFDAIRLAAAALVVVSHAFSLTGASWEPASWYLHGPYGGTLAVYTFFVLSGFLVARSAERHDLGTFIEARALRILPGLALVTLFEMLVIGPTFYDRGAATYFAHFPIDRLWNLTLWGEEAGMWGVFSGMRFTSVNGSLWTLPVEASFYLTLPAMMLAAAWRRWVILPALALALFGEVFAGSFGLDPWHGGPNVIRTVSAYSLAEFSPLFLSGVAAYLYRDRIPHSGGLALLAALVYGATRDSALSVWGVKLCLPYLVLYVGLAGSFGARLKAAVGDLSYGTYLFGYPVLQSCIALHGGTMKPWPLSAAALATTLCLAWISWHAVERPAMRLKQDIGRRRAPLLSQTTSTLNSINFSPKPLGSDF